MRPNYSSLFVRVYALMACLGIGLGVAIAAGGEQRFEGPMFEAPRNLVAWLPIQPYWSWALLFSAYGLTLVGTLGRRMAVHTLRFGIVVYFFAASCFAGSMQIDPRASAVGLVFTVFAAALHLFTSDHLTKRGWERC